MERLEDIDRAVDSIRSQRHPADELILVIDHNDELARLVRDRFQDVRVITNVEARGLSGGRNTGIAGATSDVVAFLDDDAQAHTDWLETMLPWYADQSIIAVGGSSQPVWRSGRPTWFPVEFDWVVGCSYRGLPIKAADVRNLIGSNMSFRREVFAKVGGFHSAIGRVGARPVGCEETELCIRAARQIPGSRIVYDPVVSVSHYLPEGRARWRYFRSRCYAEGLSKAIVAELTGPDRGLASERSYVTHTLPAGIVTGVREAVRERTMAPLRRAGVIIVGLGLTSTGFVVGSTRRLWSRVEQVPRSELVPPKIGNPELREPTRAAMADLTVVIPARNAAMFIEECLESVLASGPAEVIVVDGKSTDATRAIASRYPVRLLDDGGRGVAAARVMGATAARTEWVALVDVDVLLPPGALAALLDEAGDGGYTALQAGLEHVGVRLLGPGIGRSPPIWTQ
jgi:glycosyltransferase involved in cell wall biosynthesis